MISETAILSLSGLGEWVPAPGSSISVEEETATTKDKGEKGPRVLTSPAKNSLGSRDVVPMVKAHLWTLGIHPLRHLLGPM